MSSKQQAAPWLSPSSDPFSDERQVPLDCQFHLTRNNEQPEPLTSQQAGAVIIKSFQADDDIIRALFREYIYILKLATVKYRLAPKVCAAQSISTNGNPHATCLKVINQTNKLLNKIRSIPLYWQVNLHNKVDCQVQIQSSWLSQSSILGQGRMKESWPWPQATLTSQVRLHPTWPGALSAFSGHVQALFTFLLPPYHTSLQQTTAPWALCKPRSKYSNSVVCP